MLKLLIALLFTGISLKAIAACPERLQAAVGSIAVAAIQYPIVGAQTPEQFQNKIRQWLDAAKKQKANLVVFPELIALDLIQSGSIASESMQLRNLAKNWTPGYFTWIQAMAKEYQISILAGTVPRLENGQIFNTALLALADGRSMYQDKIHLTPDEKDWGWSPGSTLQLIDAPWGRTAVLICYDCEIPQLSQRLATSKPELILVPSMTANACGRRRVEYSAQARAVEHYAYVVTTGTIPTATSPEFEGHSCVLNPQDIGFPEAQARGELNQSQMVMAKLNMDQLRSKREQAGIYPARDGAQGSPPAVKIIGDGS